MFSAKQKLSYEQTIADQFGFQLKICSYDNLQITFFYILLVKKLCSILRITINLFVLLRQCFCFAPYYLSGHPCKLKYSLFQNKIRFQAMCHISYSHLNYNQLLSTFCHIPPWLIFLSKSQPRIHVNTSNFHYLLIKVHDCSYSQGYLTISF